jgi:hypothetical protein
MNSESLPHYFTSSLHNLIKANNFSISVGGDIFEQKGFTINLENNYYIISLIKEGNEETVLVQCKIPPNPKAKLSTYYLGQLVAFIQGRKVPYQKRKLASEINDLIKYENEILKVDFLNSVKLRKWCTKAAQAQMKQKRKNKKAKPRSRRTNKGRRPKTRKK